LRRSNPNSRKRGRGIERKRGKGEKGKRGFRLAAGEHFLSALLSLDKLGILSLVEGLFTSSPFPGWIYL